MTDAPPTSVPVIERTLELSASPERVWRAISDPTELARWFPQRATWDLRPGGTGTFHWEGHGDFEIRVQAVDAPRYLAWRWGEAVDAGLDDARGTTLVEWWVDPRPDGRTTLRMRESGFSTPEGRAENDHGWTEELAELTALLERQQAG